MHLQFETFYKISTSALRNIGAHPDVPKNYKWVIKFLLLHGYFTVCCSCFVYNAIFIDIKEEKDFTKACSHGILIVLYIVVSFFYLIMMWYQKDLSTLINLQQAYFDSARDLPDEDQRIVRDYAAKGRLVSKLWVASTVITISLFPIKGGIMSVHSLQTGNLTLYPIADNKYPTTIDDYKERLDVFSILYAFHLLYAVYAAHMYTGFAPLGPIFIFNTCAQVELVVKKAKLIFREKEVNREEREGKIKVIIQNIQQIYCFVEYINDIFKVVYELCLKASAVLIPVSIFVIRKKLEHNEIGLDYIMFAFTALLLCFVPCYASDLLMEKGETLRMELYSSGWEKFYDPSTRSSLIILLTRATQPISINSVFTVICLDTFSDLCRQSYALFNVMTAGLK